jgi:hypothetical protein
MFYLYIGLLHTFYFLLHASIWGRHSHTSLGNSNFLHRRLISYRALRPLCSILIETKQNIPLNMHRVSHQIFSNYQTEILWISFTYVNATGIFFSKILLKLILIYYSRYELHNIVHVQTWIYNFNLYFECTWWRLFQKCTVHTKLCF